jgi:hypothetical protein
LELKKTHGFSEFLSPVYMPFTITALLNLYDFTQIATVKEMSKACLDRCTEDILSVTLIDGTFIAPSGRSYQRHRVKTKGLHLSVFIDFVRTKLNTDRSNHTGEMALVEALAHSNYRPAIKAYMNFNITPKTITLKLSPSKEELYQFLEEKDPPDDVYVSLLWNHGMYVPLEYEKILRVIKFMDHNKIWEHSHFRVLQKARKLAPAERLAYIIYLIVHLWVVNSYVRGGFLTDVTSKTYREGNVILTSLVDYNAGLPSFQQWPWAVNLAGIPIWCSYGSVSSAGLQNLGNKEAASELSTGRVIPYMYHEGRRMIAVYRANNIFLRLANVRIRPIMRWPTNEFDEHGDKEIGTIKWLWARKSSAFMAYAIQKNNVHVIVRDLDITDMSVEQALHDIRNFRI